MAASSFGLVLQHLRKLAAGADAEQASDAHLLERFHVHGDEAAFATLVDRHAGLVWNVCRSVLRNWHDAEDAFQATFLALARKPGSIRRREAVAGWLAGVAYHLALKVQASAARRRVHEERAPVPSTPDPFLDMTLRELHCVLYEELQRLPEKCRAPLVLCYLEGRTHEQAARQLGWTKDTVRGRLNRGRERLRARLTRRGITLAAGWLTTALATPAAPAALVTSTVQAGLAQATGSSVAGAGSSPLAGFLEGAAHALLTAKGKLTLLVLLVLGLLGASLSVCVIPDPPAPAGAAAPPAPPREPDKPPPSPRTDQFGDPLPPGALARMGTGRFRHGGYIDRVAYAPDGKSVISTGFDDVCVWDASTGKEIRHLQGFTARGAAFALAPDGKTVATDREGNVELWDLATGNKMRAWPIPTVEEGPASTRWLLALAYAPDGRRLAATTAEGVLWLWDPATGRSVRQLTQAKTCFAPIVFSPDGRMVAYRHAAHVAIYLCRTDSGEEIGQFHFKGTIKGAVAPMRALGFSPDGKLLAAIFSQSGFPFEQTLCLWEIADGKEVRRWTGQKDAIGQFAFCGDGQTLALGGVDGTIRLWDLAADKESRRFLAHPAGVSALAASPDGQTLASGGGDLRLRQWDVATGKERALVGGHQNGIDAVAFLPDGRTLATAAADDSVRFWDTLTGRELRRCDGCELVGDGRIVGTVLLSLPDGRGVLGNCKGATLRSWEASSGQEVRRLQLTPGRPAATLALAPDGKILAVAELTLPTATPPLASRVSLWDLAAAKELRVLEGPHPIVVSLAFLPDGGTVVALSVEPATGMLRGHAWDSATGKERRRFDVFPLGRATPAYGFSADGRWLAVQDGTYKGTDQDFTVSLWDVAAGKEVRRLKGMAQPVGTVAFSPDGRTLAAPSEHDAAVRCWEIATGEERRRFVGHRGRGRALAFSADGTLLASGTSDTTAIVWDVGGRLNRRQGPPTAQQLEAFWADLLGDAARADHAIWDLAAAPEQALALLRKLLKPAVPADAKRVSRLLADLDSKNFTARKQAAADLEQLAELVEPALRRALADRPTPEVARQLEGLLEKAERAVLSPRGEALRVVRALEVLEHIGSPEARAFVEALAAGAPEAGLMREAKTTLQRLARRTGRGSNP
jgi:RNA polymerase sigma factor (sigma-70 family)